MFDEKFIHILANDCNGEIEHINEDGTFIHICCCEKKNKSHKFLCLGNRGHKNDDDDDEYHNCCK